MLICSAALMTSIIFDQASEVSDVVNHESEQNNIKTPSRQISNEVPTNKLVKKINLPYKVTRKKETEKVNKLNKETLKTISPRVAALWNINEKSISKAYSKRINIINKLGQNLSYQERQSLYKYIRSGPNKNAHDLAAIDYLLIKLESRNDIASEFVEEMSSIVVNKKVDGSVRGYVVQHLGIAYDDKPAFRTELREIYYNGLKEKSTDVSGTSLMVLTNLSKRFKEFDKERIKNAAIELATDSETQHASKISILSKLGELNAIEALPTLRKQVKEGKGIVIKLAAIHSLGQLGKEEDIALLEEFLADSSMPVYNKAASKALDTLKQRI